jgi:hypothetical protein
MFWISTGSFLTLMPFQTFSVSELPNEIIMVFLLLTSKVSILIEDSCSLRIMLTRLNRIKTAG